MIPTARAMLPD